MQAGAGRIPNRWVIAAAAIVMQLALGAVYAWSVFVKPLIKLNHWSTTDVTLTFTLTILALGIASAVGGFWLERVGPRLVAIVGGVLYGLGYLLAGFSTHNLTALYLTYGIIGGTGIGLSYIVPVATLVKWFPDKRGLVTGLAVCGFGGGAVIAAQIAPRLIVAQGLGTTFIVLGFAYLVMVVAPALLYVNPPAGYVPTGWTPSAQQASQRAARDFTTGEALRTPQWYILWAILALNVSAGIMLISQAAPLAENLTKVGPFVAAGLVTAISVFNAIGRVFWAWLSDLIGRRQVFLTMFALQFVVFLALVQVHNFAVLAVLAVIVALCYGGGFGTMPAFTADYFGPRRAGPIYGTMLTAWSAGGILGPILIARVKDITGGYTVALLAIAIIMAVSTVLPLVARPPQPREVSATTHPQVA
ncbi:MAG: OFA family MFS transporter [Ktedonobacterales bacterium]